MVHMATIPLPSTTLSSSLCKCIYILPYTNYYDPNTWTFACPSRPQQIPLDALLSLRPTFSPLRLLRAVRPQERNPLPLPQTFPRTWTKLVHRSHYIPQVLHRLSTVYDAIATVSAPFTINYPAIISQEITDAITPIIIYYQECAANRNLSNLLLMILLIPYLL